METEHRRRRTRHRDDSAAPPSNWDSAAGAGGVAASTSGIADATEDGSPYDAHTAGPPDDREGERGLRGLVGGGSTQVSVVAAMRARDASRPTDDDLVHAEATVTIVHRGWIPRNPADPR